MKLVYGDALLLPWLSEARLVQAEAGAAMALALEALEVARAHHYRGQEAWTLRLLGEIDAQGGPAKVEDSEAHYRRAIDLAESLGMRPLVAHCHLGLGKLYRQTTQREQAREHFATATTMYREMDMRFWLEQAEVEMRS